jgi:hypothetical protein
MTLKKKNCKLPGAGNRTRNRTGIRTKFVRNIARVDSHLQCDSVTTVTHV